MSWLAWGVYGGNLERVGLQPGGTRVAALGPYARLLVDLDHGAFDAHLAAALALGAAQHVDLMGAQIVHHVLRSRRAHVAEAVRTRRRHRHSRRCQQLERERMVRAAHADEAGAGGDLVGQLGAGAGHNRERARPEAFAQPAQQRHAARLQPDQPLCRLLRGHVADDRVGARPPLHLKDAAHSGGVERVGAQPVDGLRREGHQLPSHQCVCRLLDRHRIPTRSAWHGGGDRCPHATSPCDGRESCAREDDGKHARVPLTPHKRQAVGGLLAVSPVNALVRAGARGPVMLRAEDLASLCASAEPRRSTGTASRSRTDVRLEVCAARAPFVSCGRCGGA
eukprot:scaffold25501_cov37-Phaeocystis_antarctica.AAC.2